MPERLVEILKNNHVGNVELEDNVSEILINSDVVQFRLKDRDQLEAPMPIQIRSNLTTFLNDA